MKTSVAAALLLALVAAVSAREFKTYEQALADVEEMPLFAGLQLGKEEKEKKEKKEKSDKDKDKDKGEKEKKDKKEKKEEEKEEKDDKEEKEDKKDKKDKSSSSSSKDKKSSSSSSSSSSKDGGKKRNADALKEGDCECPPSKDNEDVCDDLWHEVCEDAKDSAVVEWCDLIGSKKDCTSSDVAEFESEDEMPLFAGLTLGGDDDKKKDKKKKKDGDKKKDGKKDKKDKKDKKKERDNKSSSDSKKKDKKDNKSSSSNDKKDKKKRNKSSSSSDDKKKKKKSSSSSSSSSRSKKKKRTRSANDACKCSQMSNGDEDFCKTLWYEECKYPIDSMVDVCDRLGSEDCWSSEDVRTNLRGNAAVE